MGMRYRGQDRGWHGGWDWAREVGLEFGAAELHQFMLSCAHGHVHAQVHAHLQSCICHAQSPCAFPSARSHSVLPVPVSMPKGTITSCSCRCPRVCVPMPMRVARTHGQMRGRLRALRGLRSGGVATTIISSRACALHLPWVGKVRVRVSCTCTCTCTRARMHTLVIVASRR